MSDPCLTDDCTPAPLLGRFGCLKWLGLGLISALLLGIFLRGADVSAFGTPTVDLPGGAVDVGDITLTGSGATGCNNVDVRVNGRSVGTTKPDANGKWSMPASIDQAGDHTVQTHCLDRSGEIVSSSATRLLLAGAGAMAVAATTLNITEGAINPGNTTLSGTGPANSTIEVYQDGKAIGQAQTDGSGNWSLDTNLPNPGDYAFTAAALGANGQAVSESGRRLLLVMRQDEPAPPPAPTPEPVVEAPPTISLVAEAEVDEGSNNIKLGGTTCANCTVELFVNGNSLGTVEADADGEYRLVTEQPAGSYEFTARVEGAEAVSADTPVTVVAPPVEEAPAEEEAGLVIIDQNRDDAGIATSGFNGTGRPNTELELLANGVVVGGAFVLADGTWRCGCLLAPGEHVVTVREKDSPDLVSNTFTIVIANAAPAFVQPTADQSVVIDRTQPPYNCPTPPPLGTIVKENQTYIVAACETLSIIASRVGSTMSLMLTHNPQVSDPRTIYPGQILNIPSSASCFDTN